MDKDTKEIALNLLEKGIGRRRIAKKLGITEWAVRKLIDEVAEVLERDEPQRPTETKRTELKNVKSKLESPSKRTKIKVRCATGLDHKKHKKVIRSAGMKVAVMSDIHYPYQDDKACEVMDMFLDDYKPDVVVYNGDIADCYAVSSYEKSVHKKMNIQEELDYTYDRLQERMLRLPSVKEWIYLEGNHEDRFKRLITREANALSALRSLRVEDSIGLEDLGIKYIPGGQELQMGNLMFTHGHLIRKHASNSARGHHEQYGCSVAIGHCHRLGVGYKRNKFGNHAFIESGTLCDFDVEYAKFPDWQHGFVTLEFDNDDFAVTLRQIDEYKLIANGKTYMI